MHALLTGASGTVGRALTARLLRAGDRVTAWDRSRVPIDTYAPMESFVRDVRPDVVFHLAVASRPTGRDGESWLVNYTWPSELSWICRVLDLPFVFTSTAMVFTDHARGPFTALSEPDAREGYGHEKRMAEGRVFHQHPGATVVRLGWQIGDASEGANSMDAHGARAMREHGVIRASTRWLPACSFLEDTAEALVVASRLGGLRMVDANARWSYADIVTALDAAGSRGWTIERTDDFVYDQRLVDDSLEVPSLRARLPTLQP